MAANLDMLHLVVVELLQGPVQVVLESWLVHQDSVKSNNS